MKPFITLVMLFLSLTVKASLIDIDHSSKKVFIHPTPELEFNLTDLGSDGGLLSIFLNYDNPRTKAELNDLSTQYSDFEVQVITAEPSKSQVRIEIPEARFYQVLTIKNGQIGPYINANLELSRSQVQNLKTIKDLESKLRFHLEVKSNFLSSRVVEEFRADEKYCDELQIKTVEDLVLRFGTMKKPPSIKYSQTFDSLKKSILSQCFQLENDKINSFQELLSTSVRGNLKSKNLVGQYLEKQMTEKIFNLSPKVKLNIVDVGN